MKGPERSFGVAFVLAVIVSSSVFWGTGCKSLSSRWPWRRPEKPALLGPRAIVPAPYRAPAPAAPPLTPAPVEPAIPVPPPIPAVSAPVPAPAPVAIEMPPPVKSDLLTYTVKKGDTLWEIARMYGVTHQELAAENAIQPGEELRLKPGTTLRIPPGGRFVPPDQRPPIKPAPKPSTASTPKVPAAVSVETLPADRKYTVQKGDSAWLIARRFGVKMDDILALNGLTKDDILQIGQVLALPENASPQAPAPAAPAPAAGTAAPTPPKDEVAVPAPDPGPFPYPKTLEHTVSEGETIEIIAEMYDTKAEAIKQKNPDIKSNADLKLNMKILVPYE